MVPRGYKAPCCSVRPNAKAGELLNAKRASRSSSTSLGCTLVPAPRLAPCADPAGDWLVLGLASERATDAAGRGTAALVTTAASGAEPEAASDGPGAAADASLAADSGIDGVSSSAPRLTDVGGAPGTAMADPPTAGRRGSAGAPDTCELAVLEVATGRRTKATQITIAPNTALPTTNQYLPDRVGAARSRREAPLVASGSPCSGKLAASAASSRAFGSCCFAASTARQSSGASAALSRSSCQAPSSCFNGASLFRIRRRSRLKRSLHLFARSFDPRVNGL